MILNGIMEYLIIKNKALIYQGFIRADFSSISITCQALIYFILLLTFESDIAMLIISIRRN